jgi:AraC-like DNA-binding protein
MTRGSGPSSNPREADGARMWRAEDLGDTVGMTPHSYLTQVRVRHAKSLLSAGLPITQVATEAGFYDQAHLTRHFKRIVGLTPGRYVKHATT